jgi:hypothetical protein
MFGVRIADNKISNTAGDWPSYIHLTFVRMDVNDFGFSSIGVEVRGNTIHANTPNISLASEESGGAEGFIARAYFEGAGQGLERNQPRLLGSIFQNNRCVGCNAAVIVREGAVGTSQDGNTNPSPDVATLKGKP